MKNMQKSNLKFILPFLLLIIHSALAQSPIQQLALGDSLFAQKQYTEALDRYTEVLDQKYYSPALFLKMAYIYEGLGALSKSLYYLSLYHLASNDKQSLKKIEELATVNHLQGYKTDDIAQIKFLIQKNHAVLVSVLAGTIIFFFALLVYQKKKFGKRPLFTGITLAILLGVLFLLVNYNGKTGRGIVIQPATYLMEGPSSGSSVIEIIGEGHQLLITGKEDVWLKVKWMGKDAYLKENEIIPIEI